MSIENEAARLNTFKNILKLNTVEYSQVLTLEELLQEITVVNLNVKKNFEYLIEREREREKNKKQIVNFKSFISKSVICFINIRNYTYSDFIAICNQIKEIKINPNLKMYDLLNKSIQELIEKDSVLSRDKTNSIYNFVQMINKGEIVCEKNIFKNYTNRFLVNNKYFEILRLILGDLIINYIFQNASLFAFEEKIQNYIQVLGLNLKTKLLNLLGATAMEKYITGPASSNHYSQRNFKLNFNSRIGEEKKIYIPNQTFEVGRTKIFYCPNFNRKLGFLKSSLKEVKKNKKNNSTITLNSVDSFYSKIFIENNYQLIPNHLEKCIRENLTIINENLTKFNYPKILFLYCPTLKGWKEKKKEITTKIKNNLKKEEFNKDLELLLNCVIEYDQVYKFVASFLRFVIPVKFLGYKNLCVLLDKVKLFIELNRFETFNKISLFDLKEFSFNDMKWLELNNMRKDTYEMIGIKLKNFIMKNIIFWIFDFMITQLLRSHFYVTEKQGYHYKSFYYHKTVWDLIMKINEIKLGAQFELISDNNYNIVSKQEMKKINKDIAIKLLKNYDLTYGKLRPMPKPTTCRPIVSYKRKTLKTGSILKNDFFETQKVFKYISNIMQLKKDTCVVFDHKTIVEKLKSFKSYLSTLNKSNGSSDVFNITNSREIFMNNSTQDLKYCTMDIEACYDNINLEKLNEILESDDIIPDVFVPHVLFVVLPKPHMLKKAFNTSSNSNPLFPSTNTNLFNKSKFNFTNYNTNNPSIITANFNETNFADCFEVKKLFFASDSNEYLNFLDFLQNKSDLNYSFCIIYQFPEMRSYIRKENFMSRVKVILNNNIIKFNKKFFRQKKGIPQGLSISSFLCNLYFYNIEKQIAKMINQRSLNNSKNLLLRFVDDYLCLTTNKKIVCEFLNDSVDLSHENRFKFNMKKSKSNIKIAETDGNTIRDIENSEVLTANSNFNWNGINFELSKENYFNIFIDSKDDYEIKKFFTLINVNLPISDASWLFKKITGIFLTGHPWIYFIPSINDYEALVKNFEDFCKVVGCKLIVLTKSMTQSNIQPGQNSFIDIMDSCLKKLFFYFNNKIQRNDNKKFFLDFQTFSQIYYENIYKMYCLDEKLSNALINHSPYFYKCIRRKVYRFVEFKMDVDN